MLAGPGIPTYELLAEQVYLLAKADGAPEESLISKLESDRVLYKKIGELPLDVEVGDEIKSLIKNTLKLSGVKNEILLEQNLKLALNAFDTPWFRKFLSYNPQDYLKKLTSPILSLNGSLDLQVAAKSNLKGIRDALTSVNHKDFTVMELKGLNHLFQQAKTGSPSEYYEIEETISPRILAVMSKWLDKRF